MYEGKRSFKKVFRKRTRKGLATIIAAMVIVVNSPLSNTSAVNVQAATKKATEIKLNTTKKTLYVGKTVTLKVKK